MSSNMAIVAVMFLSVIGVFGDYFLKKAGSGSSYIDPTLFVVGLVIYGSTGVGWFFVMKKISMASLGAVYGVTTLLLLAAVGHVCFQENLSPREWAGVVAGLLSIVLLWRFG